MLVLCASLGCVLVNVGTITGIGHWPCRTTKFSYIDQGKTMGGLFEVSSFRRYCSLLGAILMFCMRNVKSYHQC